MRIALVLAGLLLSLAALPQDIYRWVDRNGVVHYSDQPGAPNAELIELAQPANTYESDATAGDSSEPEDDAPEIARYDSLSIVSPTPDQAFFGADASVPVTAEIGGTLQPDHSLVFFVNGNRTEAADGQGIVLTNLERGTHFLRASILDRNGQPVITSQQITFHIRQPSIQNPRNPLTQPRPRPLPATPPG